MWSMFKRVCAAICATAIGCAGEQLSPKEVLTKLRDNTEQQVSKAINYSCTETVDRTDYIDLTDAPPGCSSNNESVLKQLYQHDRLRLDVAVSSTGEMFSWHGAGKFSNSGIESVVQSGAVSSGTFIGYLCNLFFVPGVLIRYGGQIQSGAQVEMTFNYEVPLQSSRQQLLGGSRKVAVPFHGSLVADLKTNRLQSLTVVIDRPPAESDVCSAEQTITYRVQEISGTPTMIPKTSNLSIESPRHLLSKSQTQFSGCHAFRGESTVHYSDIEDQPTTPVVSQQIEHGLEGSRIHASISTEINSESSFTGDLVRGILQSPLKIAGSKTPIRKGAQMEGVIAHLSFRYLPKRHYVLVILIEKIIDGNRSFLLRAKPKTSGKTLQLLRDLYGSQELSPPIEAERKGGEFVYAGRKFDTGGRLQGTWVTAP